jgi:Mn2+/Fe2+ NRAMP family transporter
VNLPVAYTCLVFTVTNASNLGTFAVLVFIGIIPTIIISITHVFFVDTFIIFTLELCRTTERTILSLIGIVTTVIIFVADVLLADTPSYFESKKTRSDY